MSKERFLEKAKSLGRVILTGGALMTPGSLTTDGNNYAYPIYSLYSNNAPIIAQYPMSLPLEERLKLDFALSDWETEVLHQPQQQKWVIFGSKIPTFPFVEEVPSFQEEFPDCKDLIDSKGSRDLGLILEWPLIPLHGDITQLFHYLHWGIDLPAYMETPVRAVDSGIATVKPFAPTGYGKWVTINHANKLISYYAHMAEVHVKTGDKVSRGNIIGEVGSTGNTTGPHLHFGFVRKNNSAGPVVGKLPINGCEFVNPLVLLPIAGFV